MQKTTFKDNKLILLTLFASLIFVASIMTYIRYKNIEDAKILYKQALDSWKLGKKKTAEQYLGAAIKKDKKAEYYYTAYRMLAGQSKIGLAELYVKKALKAAPKNTEYLYKAAQLVAYYNPEEAVGYLKQAQKLKSDDCRFSVLLAQISVEANDVAEAIDELYRCLEHEPANEAAWNNIAVYHLRQKENDKAVEVLNKACATNPNSAYLWQQKGLIEKQLGKLDQAVISLAKSVELQPYTGMSAVKIIEKITGTKYQGEHAEYFEDMKARVPFKIEGKHIFLQVEIQGKPGWFLLDTGATDSIIYKHFANEKQIKFDKLYYSSYETVAGIFDAPVSYLDISLGAIDLANVKFAMIGKDQVSHSDGIIGQNVLNNFDININYNEYFVTMKLH